MLVIIGRDVEVEIENSPSPKTKEINELTSLTNWIRVGMPSCIEKLFDQSIIQF